MQRSYKVVLTNGYNSDEELFGFFETVEEADFSHLPLGAE